MLDLELSATTALTPLDGRYGSKVKDLRPIFSEFGLIKYRSLVEVKWLQALSQESNIAEVPTFSAEANTCLLYTSPSPRDGLLSRMPSSA